MGADSSSRPSSGEDTEFQTPEDLNQVEVHTTSGEVHHVKYLLRHPNREWAYAREVTEVGDSTNETTNLVFRAAELESVKSKRVSTERPEEKSDGREVDNYTDQRIWVHHTLPLSKESINGGWKAWPSDDEVSTSETTAD
jgi:hypothetical protein